MPPKPESEPQPQPELQLTHLPSEIIAQTIEDVMTLREGDGREESLRTTVNRLADNFAMWDAETRKSFMVTMLGKQSETSSGFVDYMDKKEGGYKFPLGVNFEARFLMELPIEMRIETFWDVVREYAWDMDFSKQGDPTPVIMGNFIRSAEKAFGPADWRQIELQLVTSFAQDPNISSDGKYEAVKGYFRRAGLFADRWAILKRDTSNDAEENKLFFMEIQKGMINILLDTSLKQNFRAAILDCVAFDACDDESLSKIESVLLSPGNDLHFSQSVLHWLTFRVESRADKGEREFKLLQRIIKERTDMPTLQMEAMGRLLNQDRDNKGSVGAKGNRWSDVPEFASIVKSISQNNPEAVEENGDKFFRILGSAEEGIQYLAEFMESENLADRLLALQGAFYYKPELIHKAHVLRALSDISAVLESGASKDYLFKAIDGIYFMKWEFGPEDLFLLKRLESAMSKDDHDSNDLEFAKGMVEEMIAKLQ